MPLIRHSKLPTFERIEAEGWTVMHEGRALQQDIRELHIGFCNMMPDAAIEATERQFFRLVGDSNKIAQFYIHPFTLPVGNRGDNAREHFQRFYESFDKLREEGLDALIVTGANEETNPAVADEAFWHPLRDLIEWAHENVTSTLCSCLASHAVMNYVFGEAPHWRDEKQWGVYGHRVRNRKHPVVRNMNTIFDVPHSRYSEITWRQFENAGMRVLVDSEDAGVHVATSPDGFRLICFQGHPEYDAISLMKEYRREVQNFVEGARADYPPWPENYFGPRSLEILEPYKERILAGDTDIPFPENEIERFLENTWRDSAKSMIGNWVGAVYQTTNVDRKLPFMDGVNPDDPFGLYS